MAADVVRVRDVLEHEKESRARRVDEGVRRGLGPALAHREAAAVEIEAGDLADHVVVGDEHARRRGCGVERRAERGQCGRGGQDGARAEARPGEEQPDHLAALGDEHALANAERGVPEVSVVVEARVGGVLDHLDPRAAVAHGPSIARGLAERTASRLVARASATMLA